MMSEQAAPPPVQITFDLTGATIGTVHVRDASVSPSGLLMDPPQDLVQAERIDYFQVASAPAGVVLMVNGYRYGFDANLAGALSMALKRVITGVNL